MRFDSTSRACQDCARSKVCGNTMVCGIIGERCEVARTVWSTTQCGPEARCFVVPRRATASAGLGDSVLANG